MSNKDIIWFQMSACGSSVGHVERLAIKLAMAVIMTLGLRQKVIITPLPYPNGNSFHFKWEKIVPNEIMWLNMKACLIMLMMVVYFAAASPVPDPEPEPGQSAKFLKPVKIAFEKTSTCFNPGTGMHSILMVERLHIKSRNSSQQYN
ncbi:UNVERIFIED_CONTAM: hypothetical protein NCL1_07318 [Trichonephila clavipes]